MHPLQTIREKIDVEEAEKHSVYGRSAASSPPASDRLFFIGMRGSGKTTLGRAVAERLALPFADTDDLVEERAGKTIAEIVTGQGWEVFRNLESEVLEELCASPSMVVATGGGIVLREQNRDVLSRCGTVFYLEVDPATLLERIQTDADASRRPALTDLPQAEEVERVLRERAALYAACHHFALPAGLPVADLADRVVELLTLRRHSPGRPL